MIVNYNPLQSLPTAEDLPSSDETPVDNELQDLVPHLLLAILALIWPNRQDWFFGVDMAIYYNPALPQIVPDGFLSLGVERRKQRNRGRVGRLSYVLWEENHILPLLFLEVVSQSYNQEYGDKKNDYAALGILYYVIYDSERHHRRRGDAFEVHRLVDGVYIRQQGEPVWMPEIGLGIGREVGTYLGWTREWLYWYNESGNRYPTSEEIAQQERQRAQQAEQLAQQERQLAQQAEQLAQQERQRAENLAARLREMGIDPDTL